MAKYVNVLSEIVDNIMLSLCAELFDFCSRFKKRKHSSLLNRAYVSFIDIL